MTEFKFKIGDRVRLKRCHLEVGTVSDRYINPKREKIYCAVGSKPGYWRAGESELEAIEDDK